MIGLLKKKKKPKADGDATDAKGKSKEAVGVQKAKDQVAMPPPAAKTATVA